MVEYVLDSRFCALLGRASGERMTVQKMTFSSPSLQYRMQNAVDVAYFCLVDVSAHDAVAAATACFIGHDFLELRNEVDRVLDLMLQVLRHRPVIQPEPRGHAVEPAVEQQDQRVGAV